MKRLTVLFFFLMLGSLSAQTLPPVLFYTDLVTGMCTKGENNKGHWLTIHGNNFGASQDGSHYVKLTPTGGGGATTLDTYKYWTNTKIAVQLGTAGGCVADGDYNLQVVTPIGTSNSNGTDYHAIAFHVYSDASANIYFADQGQVTGIVGSDSNNGTSTATPFLTSNKCRDMATANAGGTCYIMPGYIQHAGCTAGASCAITPYDSTSAALRVSDKHGTAQKYMVIAGYPTSNDSQIPFMGCDYNGTDCPATQGINGIRIDKTSYFVVANMHAVVASSGASVRAFQANGPNMRGYYNRFIDIEVSANNTGSQAVTIPEQIHMDMLGWYCHDIWSASSKNGCFYIDENIQDANIGWMRIDGSCGYATPTPCRMGEGIEIHPTAVGSGINSLISGIPRFSAANLSAGNTGSLTAGTYDVLLTYRSKKYGFGLDVVLGEDRESTASTSFSQNPGVKTITLGAGQTSITVAQPANCISGGTGYGCNTYPEVQDGSTLACSPMLAYKVYACKEGVGACDGTGNGLQYQGESVYTNLNVYNGSTAPDFTITSLGAGAAPPLTDTTDVTGCNPTNVKIHDSIFKNMANWAIGAQNYGKGLEIYNNVFESTGTEAGSNQPPDGNNLISPNAIYFYDSDNNANQQEPTYDFGDVLITNNTFYNCGNPLQSDGVTPSTASACIWGVWQQHGQDGGPRYAAGGHYPCTSNADANCVYSTKTITLRNNIFYQPRQYQYFNTQSGGSEGQSNFIVRGTNNLCKGNATVDNCPAAWNSLGSGVNQLPGFTAYGTYTADPRGFLGYYSGSDLSLLSNSFAVDAGVNTSAYSVTRDINGLSRPQGAAYDIGAYEYSAGGGGGSTNSSIQTQNTIRTANTVIQ